jgi:hypothetical protein
VLQAVLQERRVRHRLAFECGRRHQLPLRSGTVTFAGRNYTHRDYSIFVTIEHDNGGYVSLSAHLSALAKNIEQGPRVTDEAIVGAPHLHQAFHRNPSYNPDRPPYGGAGLNVVYHRYLGTAASDNGGVYQFGGSSVRGVGSQGDWISN